MAKPRWHVAAILALTPLAAPTPLAAHEPAPAPRTVAVSGEGEVSVRPDRARLALGVDQLSPDVKTAEAEVNKVVRAYLAEAKALGAKEEHVQASGVSIQPEYAWDEKARRQVLVGYRVRRDVVVLVNDLDKLGDFILRATRAGVNQVHPPALESSKARELEDQALAKAAQDARARATLLASTLGARLGPVRNVSVHQAAPPPVMMKAMRAEAAGDSAGMDIAPGEIRIRAAVQAEFDLQANP